MALQLANADKGSLSRAWTDKRAALRAFFRHTEAQLNVSAGLTLAGVVIGAVVLLAIIAALMPTWFGSLESIGTNFTDPGTTTGNTDADALLPIFGLLVAFAGIFAIVGLIVAAVRLRN